MKNLILFLLIFPPLFAQAQNWEKIDLGPELSENYYIKVYFVNDDVGLMIGLNGVIIRTTDGGDTWNKIQTGVTTHFNDISFVDENIGFVNGLKTEDGGATWTVQESSAAFKFLHAINENHLIANTEVGANYYQESLDGGNNWDSIPLPFLPDMDLYAYYPNDYSLVDDQTGYLSLSKGTIEGADTLRILKTDNGGNSWNPILVPGPNPLPEFGFLGFKGISFPSENVGLLVHNNGVLKTTDGGNTFVEIIPASRPQYWDPVAIHAISTEHYLLIGLKPFISDTIVNMYETIDGGLTWTDAILAPANEYLSDAFCTSNNCFATGNGVLYRKFNTSTTSNQDLNREAINIFPNPTADFLQLGTENNSIKNIEIFGANGQRYKQYSITNNVLDVSKLPTGIYFLKIENQDAVNTYNFVKK